MMRCLLTLTATVTSGGDGNFEYSLNGGPFSGSNVFSGLSSGTFTIDVRDGKELYRLTEHHDRP